MNASNFSAAITLHTITQTFTYSNTTMLTLSIIYPKVALPRNSSVQEMINRQIRAQVHSFYGRASKDLYQQAVAAYKDAQKSGFPFHHYEAVLQYEITYNLHCHLSIYRDQYEFTGGAHGSTIRASDSWDLANGRSLLLSSLFPPGENYRAFLIKQLLAQADQQMQQNPGIYFEDYPGLIIKYFNDENYYLTPTGVAVYYQQYEIAPYATGIVVFTIPYDTLQWRPACPASSLHTSGRS
ncbi:MAG: DUF3298 and DUF4163 domain-containing protein [Christensenellales bacterium]|jgi:hypothetical protein